MGPSKQSVFLIFLIWQQVYMVCVKASIYKLWLECELSIKVQFVCAKFQAVFPTTVWLTADCWGAISKQVVKIGPQSSGKHWGRRIFLTKKGLKMEIPEFVPLSQKTKKASMEETKRKEKERRVSKERGKLFQKISLRTGFSEEQVDRNEIVFKQVENEENQHFVISLSGYF